nr:MAG TPA: hypothetical protein [Caudoviricetes sp.]
MSSAMATQRLTQHGQGAATRSKGMALRCIAERWQSNRKLDKKR